ncbi:MAG: hypothetical protein K0S44_2707 [Bacteroidetes bacterium]|jgi:hypothetical protein|nr:hypothetical protein [Bacteroidota bacterium]
MKFIQPKLFLIFLLPLCIFLTFNKHAKDGAYSYHGVIWADAAGYYIHLPIWFIHGNNADAFPEGISEKTGQGFHLNDVNNKIITKYYCGTAILISPFFFLSHALATPLGFEPDGFSKIYSYGIYFSGIVYCCMGLYFLSLFLLRHFSSSISVGIPFLLFCSTNLYYYSIDSPGMSHVYSFFLFTVFLYSVQQLLDSENILFYISLIVSFALAVITRPTNGLIFFFPFFYENGKFLTRFGILIKQKLRIIVAMVLGFLCILPQLLYFKNSSGSYFINSYHKETFINFLHPFILETWFSTNNGLFLYAPILLLAIAGIFLMMRQRNRFGYYLLFTFLLISYLFASWWNWWFGCALGARSFVEFYVLLSIPMAYLMREALQNKVASCLFFIFSVFCICFYMNIEYYYDGCFYGGTWDFQSFIKLLQ